MSGSYLDSAPSPVGRYKTDLFNSDTSDTFNSDSEDGEPLHGARTDEYLILPPRLSSTFDRSGSAELLTNTKHAAKRDPSRAPNSSSFNDVELSVWEQWLVKKLQVEQESLQQKRLENQKLQEEEKQRKKEKEERMKAAQEKHTKWAEEKLLKLKIQKATQEREKKIKKELELIEKEKKTTKAEENFQRWIQKRNETDNEKRKKEKERKEEEKKIEEEKRKKSEEQYDLWLKKNKERFEAIPKAGPAMPSYVNPNPWVGCNQDETRRRPRSPRMPSRRSETRPRSAVFADNPRPSARKPSRPETHTPMRTGPNHSRIRPQSGLVRTETPLRFAGIRPRTSTHRIESKIPPPVPLQASTPTRSSRTGKSSSSGKRHPPRRPA